MTKEAVFKLTLESDLRETFLEQKVAQARRSMETGTGRLDAEVAADFAARRADGE